ncbi:MAG: NADH-quinone oxidoreductase subunit N [Gaiella sp.]
MIDTPHVDWLALSPSIALLGAAGLCLIIAVTGEASTRRDLAGIFTFAGFVGAAGLAVLVYDRSPEAASLIADSMSRDRLAALTQIVLAAAGAVAVMIAWSDRRRDHVGEFYALLATAGAGLLFFVSATNLMTLFLGLEWFSIPLYILCAMDTHRKRSLEAGLKYLIVGAFGSAILLFGCALVYGATGTLSFEEIRLAGAADDPLFVGGLAMLLVGLGFKASAAPFHMWTPDVYQGAPTSVTAFMSATTKIAAVVVTLRLLVTSFPEQAEIWTVVLAVLVCLSLAVGNLAALAQKDVKRMLAYSSVSQAGFMLIAILANNETGAKALLYFLVPYAAASLGAFAVVAARERELGRQVTVDTFAGFGWERPLLGAAMWIFMLGFAGFPLTGGFLGKFYVFAAAFEAGEWWIVVVGVVATAVSIAYYLGLVRAMYMRPGAAPSAPGVPAVAGGSPPPERALGAAALICVVVVVGSFFAVQPMVDLARDAAAVLPF